MLKETYVAKLKNLPKNTIKIEVGYPSVFAPSESLISEFNKIKSNLMKKDTSEIEARNIAWKQTDFEKRFRNEIESKPDVIQRLKDIRKLSDENDVYLYCYCGKYPCHRFILIEIIENLNMKL